jgi:signal transduction histidine kinase
MEDDDHSVWLYTSCGLLRVAQSDLEQWVQKPASKLQATQFDLSDGVMKKGTYLGFFGPPVAKAPDGKIWFTHDDGVTRIDPRHLPHNKLPPPVYVGQITADGNVYDAGAGRLVLPPRVRDLAIDYTSLSLVAPEKARFRVKLEGQDRDWRELVNQRQVHYTNLPPKDYRFRVKAANNSGVWNEEGAFLDLTVPPAWYETTWFRVLCLSALGSLLWAAHRVRVAILERHQRLLERHQTEITALNARLMKAQEEERSRIAGELHDGIAQQMTTANLLLGTAKRQGAPGSDAILDEAQDLLIAIGADLRQLSHELHPAVLKEAGLPAALSSYCNEFSKTRCIPVSCEADPGVIELSRGSALALFRIAQEALGNAAKHANAKQLRVRLARADGVVRLTVADDGVGFVPRGAASFRGVGLVNMRERARQLDGTVEIESEPGRGTTVRAEIPFRPAESPSTSALAS